MIVAGILPLIIGMRSLYQLVHGSVHALIDGLWLLAFILVAMDAIVLVGTWLVYRNYSRDKSHPVWVQVFMTGGYFAISALILSFAAVPIESALVPK